MNKSAVLLLFLLAGCQSAVVHTAHSDYPDLEGYFKKEIDRLEQTQPQVEKSVHINKKNEKKLSSSINWPEEFNLFIASDIKKPAFKGLYTYRKEGNEDSYTATDSTLKTREIRILKTGTGKIKRISIQNFSKNTLYNSTEYLEYCPDSIYQIVKKQEVLLLGSNHFMIVGKFKK